MNGFELQILVFLSGSLCVFSVHFSSSYPGHQSPSLTQPGQSECCQCVSCTLATCHTTLSKYKPLERDGWEQAGASRPVHAPFCALPVGIDREWAALLGHLPPCCVGG